MSTSITVTHGMIRLLYCVECRRYSVQCALCIQLLFSMRIWVKVTLKTGGTLSRCSINRGALFHVTKVVDHLFMSFIYLVSKIYDKFIIFGDILLSHYKFECFFLFQRRFEFNLIFQRFQLMYSEIEHRRHTKWLDSLSLWF